MTAYYNEFDPFAAAWLRELISAGLIAPGDVDERDMREVTADEIKGYTQHHFFAGIGGWSLALRMAGWPDDRPVLTGSPPCQPFSSAGKRLGAKDERHLAPHFIELVRAIRPAFIFGEQVAAAINKDAWLDDLLDELEAENYATGAIVLPACSIGAPHIRQRLWFVGRMANSDSERHERDSGIGRDAQWRVEHASAGCGMGNSINKGLERHSGHGDRSHEPRRVEADTARPVAEAGNTSRLADTADDGHSATNGLRASIKSPKPQGEECVRQLAGSRYDNPTNTTQAGWNGPDWLWCRDGKWRPVESGTFPLANGIPARVGRLRGYGNAIVPQVAAEIIKEIMGAV